MRILVVEDDPRLREALVDSLEFKGFKVAQAAHGVEGLSLARAQNFDLVLSDINMPGMDGLELLAELKKHTPWLPVILMTAYGDVGQAVKAMQLGANDYLMKPFELKELEALLRPYNPAGAALEPVASDAPICAAASTKQLFALAERVARTDSTVLISGESGTGKEVLARYIHQHSARAKKPFVAINCAAIPENMLEAMLFGYEKGAFTGAYNAMPGKFEQAEGGTLLLDEITEMDAALQAKLLRVLQERQVERLGGKKLIDLDVRIIATTNRELADYVAEGKFREDLYYRLTVFPLQWLPLRARSADILPLAQSLIAHHASKMKRSAPRLSASAQELLLSHSWPGNVRELDNTVQRALILQAGNELGAQDFILTPVPKHRQSQAPAVSVAPSAVLPPMPVDTPAPERTLVEEESGGLGEGVREREVELVLKALQEEPSRKDAAERLGISPRTLRYKIAKWRDEGIDLEARLAGA